MWTDFFSKVLLVNLPERTDRFQEAVAEMTKHGIKNYEWVTAHKDEESGARGLHKTLFSILERAKAEDWDNILILEDDCVLTENSNQYLETMIQELKYLDWDLFYLGGNVNSNFVRVPKCDYLLRCDMIISTHALAYSKQGWKLMLQEMRRIKAANVVNIEPIDLTLARVIQPRGKTYIANPMLATQRPGWSDVEQRETDYKHLIQDRYAERLKHIEG
jgi:GR25 family glycosyltransferase involved in LPS biosynthesis